VAILLWIISIGWMCMIFYLSSQDGKDTAKTSYGVVEKVADVVYSKPSQQQKNTLHLNVRKMAHVGLFFVLGILLFMSVTMSLKVVQVTHWVWLCSIPIVLVSCYGYFDEWHKQFIVGRHFDSGETLLNVACGIGGVLATMLLRTVYRRTVGKNKIVETKFL
ncbi:MAG: VanZ family protein, partial [Bacilli bacterium]